MKASRNLFTARWTWRCIYVTTFTLHLTMDAELIGDRAAMAHATDPKSIRASHMSTQLGVDMLLDSQTTCVRCSGTDSKKHALSCQGCPVGKDGNIMAFSEQQTQR